MDPWAGDCYILRYGPNDPAAIVTSIDFVRARARTQPDCQGWTAGVIVLGKDGRPYDSSGLVLDGETLVGGWAECTPKGWLVPTRLEVNLAGYIKKTAEGKITKFWQPDNQPTMIAKVAEMQLLRRIWPAAAGKMYLAEEVGGPVLGEGMDLGSIDMELSGNGRDEKWREKGQEPTDTVPDDGSATLAEQLRIITRFNGLMGESGIKIEQDVIEIKRYISMAAVTLKKTEIEMMEKACLDFPGFLKMFSSWKAKKNQALKEKYDSEHLPGPSKEAMVEAKTAAKKAKPAKDPRPPSSPDARTTEEQVDMSTGEVTTDKEDNRPDGTFITCTAKEGDEMTLGYCRSNCPSMIDCEDHKPE
jgi:hypothetical protein